MLAVYAHRDVERGERAQLIEIPEAVDKSVRDSLLPTAVCRSCLPRPQSSCYTVCLGHTRQRCSASMRVVQALRVEVGSIQSRWVQFRPTAERVHVESEVVDVIALGQAFFDEGPEPRQPLFLVLGCTVGVRSNKLRPRRCRCATPHLI